MSDNQTTAKSDLRSITNSPCYFFESVFRQAALLLKQFKAAQSCRGLTAGNVIFGLPALSNNIFLTPCSFFGPMATCDSGRWK